MLPKVARIGWLFDFYGPLLTDKQRELVDLYFNHDLTLAEIATEYGVSRQAVHDILKRAEQALEEYEEKLGLLSRFLAQRQLLVELYDLLQGDQVQDRLVRAKEIISAMTQQLGEELEG